MGLLKNAGLFFLGLCSFTFSLTLIIVGANVRNTYAPQTSYEYRTCTLHSRSILQCSGGQDRWLVVYDGGTAVEEPFSVKNALELAVPVYPLNATYHCMCPPMKLLRAVNPAGDCSVWTACILNVELVEYMQQNAAVYVYGGTTMLAIGSLILCFTFLGALLIIILGGHVSFLFRG